MQLLKQFSKIGKRKCSFNFIISIHGVDRLPGDRVALYCRSIRGKRQYDTKVAVSNGPRVAWRDEQFSFTGTLYETQIKGSQPKYAKKTVMFKIRGPRDGEVSLYGEVDLAQYISKTKELHPVTLPLKSKRRRRKSNAGQQPLLKLSIVCEAAATGGENSESEAASYGSGYSEMDSPPGAPLSRKGSLGAILSRVTKDGKRKVRRAYSLQVLPKATARKELPEIAGLRVFKSATKSGVKKAAKTSRVVSGPAGISDEKVSRPGKTIKEQIKNIRISGNETPLSENRESSVPFERKVSNSALKSRSDAYRVDESSDVGLRSPADDSVVYQRGAIVVDSEVEADAPGSTSNLQRPQGNRQSISGGAGLGASAVQNDTGRKTPPLNKSPNSGFEFTSKQSQMRLSSKSDMKLTAKEAPDFKDIFARARVDSSMQRLDDVLAGIDDGAPKRDARPRTAPGGRQNRSGAPSWYRDDSNVTNKSKDVGPLERDATFSFGDGQHPLGSFNDREIVFGMSKTERDDSDFFQALVAARLATVPQSTPPKRGKTLLQGEVDKVVRSQRTSSGGKNSEGASSSKERSNSNDGKASPDLRRFQRDDGSGFFTQKVEISTPTDTQRKRSRASTRSSASNGRGVATIDENEHRSSVNRFEVKEIEIAPASEVNYLCKKVITDAFEACDSKGKKHKDWRDGLRSWYWNSIPIMPCVVVRSLVHWNAFMPKGKWVLDAVMKEFENNFKGCTEVRTKEIGMISHLTFMINFIFKLRQDNVLSVNELKNSKQAEDQLREMLIVVVEDLAENCILMMPKIDCHTILMDDGGLQCPQVAVLLSKCQVVMQMLKDQYVLPWVQCHILRCIFRNFVAEVTNSFLCEEKSIHYFNAEGGFGLKVALSNIDAWLEESAPQSELLEPVREELQVLLDICNVLLLGRSVASMPIEQLNLAQLEQLVDRYNKNVKIKKDRIQATDIKTIRMNRKSTNRLRSGPQNIRMSYKVVSGLDCKSVVMGSVDLHTIRIPASIKLKLSFLSSRVSRAPTL